MNHIFCINNISAESMREKRLMNEGKMAEQFIAQHLLYSEAENKMPSLYYWLREKRKGNAEVDFLIQDNNTISPVEVKAGKTGSLKSLHRFVYEKKADLAIRFDLNPPSFHKTVFAITNFNLLSLPLYMIQQTRRISTLLSSPEFSY